MDGKPTPAKVVTTSTISIVDQSPRVDALLEPYRIVLGAAYAPYRGHILRVLTYALHILDEERHDRKAIEVALVFHDLSAFIGRSMRYLEPSVELALEANRVKGWGYEPELLNAIILYHHKVTPYRGIHAPTVNAVRRADWIEVTQGRMRMGLPEDCIEKVNQAIPQVGFSDLLSEIGVAISGTRTRLFLDLLHVFKL